MTKQEREAAIVAQYARRSASGVTPLVLVDGDGRPILESEVGEQTKRGLTMPTSDNDPNSAARVREAFSSLVCAVQTRNPGMSRRQCVVAVSRKHPELHRQYCASLPRGGPVIGKQR